MIRALNRLGATHTMESYLHFIDQVAATGNGAGIQPLFGIGGDTSLPEHVVAGLPGYRSMGPVRVGNLAYVQKQNDVYGAAILACTRLLHRLAADRAGRLAAVQAARSLRSPGRRVANLPDAGPREFRGTEPCTRIPAAMSWAAAIASRGSRRGSVFRTARATGARADSMRERS